MRLTVNSQMTYTKRPFWLNVVIEFSIPPRVIMGAPMRLTVNSQMTYTKRPSLAYTYSFKRHWGRLFLPSTISMEDKVPSVKFMIIV